MKKYLKLFIFIMIIIFTPKVFAQDFNVNNSDITSPSGQGRTGTYSGLEIYNGGSPAVYDIGTRYNGRLSRIWFNLAAGGYADANGFEKGHTYTLTMNMATDDWRNGFGSVSVKCEGSSGQELSNKRVTFINYKKIKFSFTAPTDRWCQFVYVDLMSSDISSTYITGTSNWNLSSLVITDPAYDSSSGGSGSGDTSSSTQDIINNANNNTNDIIDNANSNTDTLNQSINNSCKNTTITLNQDYTMLNGKYLNVNGSEITGNPASISKYIRLKPGTSYTLKLISGEVPSNYSYCLYSNNNVIYRCFEYANNNEWTFTADNYTVSFRASLSSYRLFQLTGEICNNWDNENTQDIINNQNQNTQDIINNQNQNTQQQIDSQKVCNTTIIDIDKTISNGFLYTNGNYTNSTYYRITDYISLNSGTLTLTRTNTSSASPSICFYNSSRALISCISNTDLSIGEVSIPNGASYFRASINISSNSPQYELKICQNGNQSLSDSLTDSNVDSGVGSDFFSDFQDNSHGLTSIITSPLTAIESITSSTCQPLSIPIPFTNGNVNLPCMTQIYENNIPTIYNIWKIVSFGIIAYFICIDIFHIVKGFKDPESDKVEVLDL